MYSPILLENGFEYFSVKGNFFAKKDGKISKVTEEVFSSLPEKFKQLCKIVSSPSIFIKEGRTQVEIFDWTKLDKTNENSFIIDTTFMIPREYHLQIKANTHTEEIFYKDTLNFEIVSEK